jgi:DMSO/TMAO reductase YedYZ molybdopterin-dependent catalytic subunit
MRRNRLRPLSAAVIAVLSAMAVSGSGVLAHDRSHGPPERPAAGSLVVTGNVQRTLRLSVADLAAMPDQKTVEVAYHAGTGTEHHTFTGPLLLDVLAAATPTFDTAVKNDELRHYVAVTASDAYQALLAYGELDPAFENKQILLAVTQDGTSLADQGPRLVVPGDAAGGRYVTGIVKVKISKPHR